VLYDVSRTVTTVSHRAAIGDAFHTNGRGAFRVANMQSKSQHSWASENELGLRKWLEDQGHTLVTTSDKEGENSKFDQELVDAEVIITTP
jgi:hypothetical protein